MIEKAYAINLGKMLSEITIFLQDTFVMELSEKNMTIYTCT